MPRIPPHAPASPPTRAAAPCTATPSPARTAHRGPAGRRSALGAVAIADVQGGRARLRPTPSGYSLARMGGPAAPRDVEATLTVEFEDLDTQGIGFYVRQNGGYLGATAPTGAGYAVFVEGFRGFDGIGVWREVDGVEQAIAIDMGLALADGVPYRVRFRVHQQNPTTTRLQAKLWPADDPEPLLWNVDATDTTPSLQNVAGAVAADSWSEITSPGPITAHTFIDDVALIELCNPVAGIGAVTTVSERASTRLATSTSRPGRARSRSTSPAAARASSVRRACASRAASCASSAAYAAGGQVQRARF